MSNTTPKQPPTNVENSSENQVMSDKHLETDAQAANQPKTVSPQPVESTQDPESIASSKTKLDNHVESNRANPPSKKSKLIRIGFILFLVAMVALGLWLAYKPEKQQIQGMVEAKTINVSTKIPSRVEQLFAHEGDQVKKGQVLGTLTSPAIQAKQEQALGVLQSAKALEQTALRGSQQENIDALKANWQSAQAQAHLAQITFQRADNLLKEGVISRQRRDEAQAAKLSATQLAEAARQQYLRAERGSTNEQLSSAQAQVKIAQAGVFEANALNEEMQLIAPDDGEVSESFANVGELVAAGIPLYTLVDLKNQWVSINLREDQFNQLKLGSILHGDIPALNQSNVAFKVSHIAAQGTFASWKPTRQSSGYDVRTFEIKLKPIQPIANLHPGMSVLFVWPQTSNQAVGH